MAELHRILNKQYKTFTYDLQNKKIEDYFGISSRNRKLSIRVNKCNNNKQKYMVEINCIKPQSFVNIMGLPLDIARKIHTYIPEYIKITFCIYYPEHYPFTPPVWSLDKISHRVNTQLNLTEYYKYIVDAHNGNYDIDWSPAIKLEADLIIFIQKINHFDMIFEYN